MWGAADKALTYSINKAHELLGHNNENDTRQIESHSGWTITRMSLGMCESCESCANAKARQKTEPKISISEKATVINGRWFQDNSTQQVRKGQKVTTKTWTLTVDELIGLPWTGIYNKKNEFIESMCQCIQVKARGYPVLIMRQDNAGENKKLEQKLHSADWKLQVKMEYNTAADTPQQNALVKL